MLGLARLSGRRVAAGGVAVATPDATGKIYTLFGLKAGSTATLFGDGSQLATATVNSAGRAQWTLANRPADGVIITWDGTVTGSGGTVTPSGVAISGTPGQAIVGQAYFWAPTVTGGSGTKVFTLSAGTLPAGLSLNASTGAITGTPTAPGTTSGIAITVTDSSGSATLSGQSITVAAIVVPINGGFGAIGASMIGNGSAQIGSDATARAAQPGDASYNGSTAARSVQEWITRYSKNRAYTSPTLAWGLGGDTISQSNLGPGALARAPSHIVALKAAGVGWVYIHAVGNEIAATRAADGLPYTAATVLQDLDALIKLYRDAGIVVVLSSPTPHGSPEYPSSAYTGSQLQMYKDIRAGFAARHDPSKGVYNYDSCAPSVGLCGDLNALTYAAGVSPDGLHVHGVGAALMGKGFWDWAQVQGFLPATPSLLMLPGAAGYAGALQGNPNMTDSDANGIPDGWLPGTPPAGIAVTHIIVPHPTISGLFRWRAQITGTPTGTANTRVVWIMGSRTTTSPTTAAGRRWSMLAGARVDAINGATDHGIAGFAPTLRQDFAQVAPATDYTPEMGRAKVDTAPATGLFDRVPGGVEMGLLTEWNAPLPDTYAPMSTIVERFLVDMFVGVAVNANIDLGQIDTRENRVL